MPRNVTSSGWFRAILFLLPLLLLGGGAECLLRNMPNAYRTKAARMAQTAPQTETLILGASHNLMGIRPDLLGTKSFNLAGVSQTIDIDADLLETYLPSLKNLKTVVACPDAGILFDPPLHKGAESFRSTYYNLYMPTPRRGTWPHLTFETASYTGVKNKLDALLEGDTDPHIDSLGWYNGYVAEKEGKDGFTPERFTDRAAYLAQYGTDYLEENRSQLRRLYGICHAHGIRVVLVLTPVLPELTAALKAWMHKEVAETLAEYRDKPDVTILDYSRDKRFTETDFFDTDHLNTDGAAKFTRILRTDARL